jgi:hypothetical protein
MAQEGYPPLLTKSRWCVLKRKQNLTSQQKFRLRDLLRHNLQTVRAYLLKRFSAVLRIHLARMGRHARGFLALSNHAIPYRTEEENHPHLARSPYPAAQRFQGQEAVFQWCDRGAHNKAKVILWFSHLPHPGTHARSLTWQTTPTGAYP